MAEKYDDYEINYEDENIDDEDRRVANTKKVGIAILVILGIIVLMFLLKGCFGGEEGGKTPTPTGDRTSTLLQAGKDYFEYNSHLMAKNVGECVYVTLKTLSEYGLVNPKDYEGCDTENTYVKACVLESKTIQWTPWLTCPNERSDDLYGSPKEGTEKDLKKDESDVSFKFLPQKLETGSSGLGSIEELWQDEIKYTNYKTLGTTTYYRYRDQEFKWDLNVKYYYTSKGETTKASDVKEYYISSPKSGYTNKDNKVINAAKWYTTDAIKIYWLGSNGSKDFSMTQPSSEFPYYDGGVTFTRYSTRTFTQTGTPTPYAPLLIYECAIPTNTTSKIYSTYACGTDPKDSNNRYSLQIRTFYACNTTTFLEVSPSTTCKRCTVGTINASESACGDYSAWSSFTTKKCTGASDVCKSRDDTFYNWFKYGEGTRTYYPSGANSASGEKIYYTSAPIAGAVKDISTIATAYKWYRLVAGQTSGYSAVSPQDGAAKTTVSRWTEWTDWSITKPKDLGSAGTRQIESKIKVKLQQITGEVTEGDWKDIGTEYLSESEMIALLKEQGYKVESLADINANGELRYKVKMYIRNKEVK